MKKHLSIALLATAVLLASCSKDDAPVPDGGQNAISFGAYVKTPVTKGEVESASTIQAKGVGIFAFYQPAVGGIKTLFNTRKFATPDFMYNQKLTYASGTSTWSYSPLKYWPNNVNDLLSFFAYAPYEPQNPATDQAKAWDELGVTTDAVASKLSVSFNIADEVENQEDILWATPLLNKTNKDASNVNQLTTSNLTFEFSHMTSKVGIKLGVDNPSVSGSAAEAWTEGYKQTVIQVKSIAFSGLYDSYRIEYAINADGSLGTVSNSSTGSMDLTVKPYVLNENTANEVNFGRIYWDAATLADNYWHAGWHNYLEAADTAVATAATEYLFLAPQDFADQDATVAITYTVKTTASNAANSSEITNTIEKNLSQVFETTASAANGKIEQGKAYNLRFLIGMDDVNISSELTDWQTASNSQIFVPQNSSNSSLQAGPWQYTNGSGV